MKVLLISPLPGIDPPCGDIIYTEALLANPPEGVEYETYAEALERGALVEHASRVAVAAARERGTGLIREFALTAMNNLVNRLRAKKLMFWEPFRYFTVRPGEYDLVHLHVFSARFNRLDCPLVVSNACALGFLYRYARGCSAFRVYLMELADRVYGKLTRCNLVSYDLPQADRLISFTDYLKDWYVGRRIIPEASIDVVPIYLPSPETRSPAPGHTPHRIGFVAKDFEAKGGRVLLDAFDLVRKERPDAELVIVGSEPCLSASELEARGIQWHPIIPRDELMSEWFPSFDVFAYPTLLDGLPLVILEALSLGVPVVTSDYQAMPETVDHGRAGRVAPVGDHETLASGILEMLDPQCNAECREQTTRWFERKYSVAAVTTALKSSYLQAIRMKSGDAEHTPRPKQVAPVGVPEHE